MEKHLEGLVPQNPGRSYFFELHFRLKGFYGEIHFSPREPTEELISTILSQNTNDRNRDLAFSRLKEAFSSFKEVALAPTSRVEELIRVGGLSRLKAPRIQEILLRVKEKFGSFSLPKKVEKEELIQFLRSLPGVGPKTLRCVLLFSYNFPFFPIDTHIFRIGKRLGFIGKKESPDKAMVRLDDLIPSRLHLPLHFLLIKHGRTICRPKPLCGACFLQDICDFFKTFPS